MEQNGRLKVSENAVTSPGDLPCNFLIHAVGPYYHSVINNAIKIKIGSEKPINSLVI